MLPVDFREYWIWPCFAQKLDSWNVEQFSNDKDQQGTLHAPNTLHVEKLHRAQFWTCLIQIYCLSFEKKEKKK